MQKPLIITMGDPTGIGPEIIVKALLAGSFDGLSHPVVVAGDPHVLQQAATTFHQQAQIKASCGPADYELRIGEKVLAVKALSHFDPLPVPGAAPDAAHGLAMAEYIEWACARCRDGNAAGMVTAPISKAAIRAAGYDFPGHTELLARRCGVERVVMMLAGARLRVSLVTTHLPLRAVPQALSRQEIFTTLRITDGDLKRYFGLKSPRIAVTALNPHAGEGGLFGDEEQRLIEPAVREAQAAGIDAQGPFSADTLFHFAVQGRYDAVVCMYHDQALIPLKLLHFDDGVNLTLGLPIVRTSVDHGTAHDIAGTGTASADSLVAAVLMAARMADEKS
ncbi:MAG: 4-hydroxythreonine-4-phosphate dehydrogenase PdxA [Geoalkalibacter sp.]|uniref:4-hydroxythreonine-4-phosphate dehydrogenase PdxA n=1 Tax=Geoalkalibacter sp. TaxID=3041440 RepID=UPI002A9E6CF3|nr:4-hydroxythreonine-4-phosphate dehydrogenase PdxA [Thermodesulfobacteriota bacterium]